MLFEGGRRREAGEMEETERWSDVHHKEQKAALLSLQ